MTEQLDTWTERIPTTESKTLPPDPRVMESIGLNHALETAVADLVDNSIDAGATRILIRFVRRGIRLVGLCVVDDGTGINSETIDDAMRVGGQRDYRSGDLGHFGVGLKAASFGQASSLTVLSRSNGVAVGRRWLVQKASKGFECDVVEPSFAASVLDRGWGFLNPTTGTVVRWDGVRNFPTSNDPIVTDKFIEGALVKLRHHLGLVFHRMLEKAEISIAIDLEDADGGDTGILSLVEPIDPFGYTRSPRTDYPKVLRGQAAGLDIPFTCHIWPGRSELAGFKLSGDAAKSQGFFFYRRDRLLQAGGWNGVFHPERHFQLARVAVDIYDHSSSIFKMNPEKTRVDTPPDFTEAIENAIADDGTDFLSFLEHATFAFKESRRRTRVRPKVLPPGSGFAPVVKKAVSKEFEFIPGEEPIDVRWVRFHDESFFDLDHEQRVLWLNNRYRHAVTGQTDGSLNDAPLVKALLYLLMEDAFRGSFLGAKDRDLIDLWQGILTRTVKRLDS